MKRFMGSPLNNSVALGTRVRFGKRSKFSVPEATTIDFQAPWPDRAAGNPLLPLGSTPNNFPNEGWRRSASTNNTFLPTWAKDKARFAFIKVLPSSFSGESTVTIFKGLSKGA